ncbi:3429_t:CDS:2 [Entrophospora sp. SA101]|nr:3429_t:CDS:2 [Entrophospora sp. SA101]
MSIKPIARYYNFFIITTIIISILLLATTTAESNLKIRKRDYDKRFYYAIEVENDSIVTPKVLENLLDVKHEGIIGELDNYHLFSSAKEDVVIGVDDTSNSNPLDKQLKEIRKRSMESSPMINKRSLEVVDGILTVDKQVLRKRHKRVPLPPKNNNLDELDPEAIGISLGISDPGITGKGVTAAIVDDGLDMDSEDLADNFFAEGSYDFNDHTPLPKPRLLQDTHGTRCAGEIAAAKNSVCGIGVAPDAKIAGLRVLSSAISDVDEAEALNYKFQMNDIYSCSWGPPDDGKSAAGPKGVILKAIIKGIKHGRGGKGSLFVFAAGNGGLYEDNCNYDGYANSIYTLTIGAVDRRHGVPYYAEKCSALLISTYSSGGGSYIYTTDVGSNKCTNLHGGTSAAAPLVTGALSLT